MVINFNFSDTNMQVQITLMSMISRMEDLKRLQLAISCPLFRKIMRKPLMKLQFPDVGNIRNNSKWIKSDVTLRM